MPLCAQVAVSGATVYYDKLYTYLVPAVLDGHIFVGSMVLVPFGRGAARPRVGVVLALQEEAAPDKRVKTLLDAAPEEARLTDELLAIVRYLRDATFCTWFDAVRAVIPYGAQYRIERNEEGAWRLKKQLARYTETVYALPVQGPESAGEAVPGGKDTLQAVTRMVAGAQDAAGEETAESCDAEVNLYAADAVSSVVAAVEAAVPTGRRLTEKQRQVLAFLREGPRSRAEICEGCGVGPSVAENLADKGLLLRLEADKGQRDWGGDVAALGAQEENEAEGGLTFELSPAQAEVAMALQKQMEAAFAADGDAGANGDKPTGAARRKAPKPALLYGVTGSGKTPVFLSLVRAALRAGKTALVLVPEIGLTPQMIRQMRAAFGRRVAVQHSGLSATERLLQWRAIQRGEAEVVVGTRSAVFAPLENIGIVVVDEEQERSYQSENAPRYDAVEVARRRALRHGALLLLASATPSVAAFYAARQGRFDLHCLRERYNNIPLPAVELVDMRAEMMAGNPGALSRQLATGIEEAIAAGGQVILLLNRRGYHRVAVCRDCGKAVRCGDCSVPMVFHKAGRGRQAQATDEGEQTAPGQGQLVCHYCGRVQSPAPEVCPECGGALRYIGFGTQRLEDELAERLPHARVLRMDLDTTQRKGAHEAMLARFAAGEYDILLGTQMVAKGLDFERVRLVGVVGIDSLLFSQGYRAYETVFSLVTQVVGRAGRGGAAGQGLAMIQTVDPASPVLNLAAKQDYEAFYSEEIGFRKLALYPPFCSLCLVGFVSADEAAALKAARRFAELLAKRAAQRPDIPLRVLGPAPMQVMQVAGSFRYRLTLKCRNNEAFRSLARQVLEDYNEEGWPRKVAVYLDFNTEG